jgi:hypothetical protein
VPVIDISDLPAALQDAELIQTLVDGANSKAARVAPCLIWDESETDKPAPSQDQLAEARLILIGAIRRWADAGSGAYTQQSSGPFAYSTDTRTRTGYNLWPSEITDLQAICSSDDDAARAFSIDTVGTGTIHAEICSANRYVDDDGNIVYGGAYCTCGADIAGEPIYESP